MNRSSSPQIISVSRRTDIPAFYGEWFLRRIQAGGAGYLNPFNHRKFWISLTPEDVACFCFWSKNYSPFMAFLPELDKRGYNLYFHYTITGLPKVFEPHLISTKEAVANFKALSRRYAPDQLNWRYDPILFSDITDETHHLCTFERLAAALQGYTHRCYISFVDATYVKVKRAFKRFQKERGIQIRDLDVSFRVDFANRLAQIAKTYGIDVYTCCGDYLVGETVQAARCIDGEIIQRLFFQEEIRFKKLGSRKECGCSKSVDIGVYHSCPHGCVYCYANIHRQRALEIHAGHDPHSAFLGYSRTESDEWVKALM